jgi:hypothetical protein
MAVSHFVRSHVSSITTPTVKARFSRLVNVGFIKSVSPILNFELIEKEGTSGINLDKEHKKTNENSGIENENKKTNKLDPSWQLNINFKLRKGL